MNINKSYNNFLCPHEVLEDIKFKSMPLSAKYLYIILCKLSNRYEKQDPDGWFWRSIGQLMEDCNLSRRAVIQGKQLLLKNQFIDVQRQYYIHSKKRAYDSFKLNGFKFRIDSEK